MSWFKDIGRQVNSGLNTLTDGISGALSFKKKTPSHQQQQTHHKQQQHQHQHHHYQPVEAGEGAAALIKNTGVRLVENTPCIKENVIRFIASDDESTEQDRIKKGDKVVFFI